MPLVPFFLFILEEGGKGGNGRINLASFASIHQEKAKLESLLRESWAHRQKEGTKSCALHCTALQRRLLLYSAAEL